MSRIEEALKRASQGGARALHAVEESVVTVRHTSNLTDYPEEVPAAPSSAPPRQPAVPPRKSGRTAPEQGHLGPFPDALEGKLILSHAAPMAVEQYRRLAATL